MNNALLKLERYLFYFFLFAIPFQTRKILYHPGWLFNEWQGVFIYGTDLLLAVLFIFWMFDFKIKFSKTDYFLVAFVIISGISIKNSSAMYLSFYSLLKLIEFVIFYFYIKNYALQKFDRLGLLLALICGGLFQSVIAIVQFFRQEDLGLRLLGESVLNLDTRGIASFISSSGEKIIRSYGTAPHPNVLAGYLLLAIFAFYAVYAGFHKKFASSVVHIPASMIYGLILFGFFFTFSRAIIGIWGVLFIIGTALIFKYKKEHLKALQELLIMTAIFSFIFLAVYWPAVSSRLTLNANDEALTMRVFYNNESLRSGTNIFGVGTGNFVNWLIEKNPNLPPWLYQPVHNIYLLVYSETGILGIGALILFIVFLFRDFLKGAFFRSGGGYAILFPFVAVLLVGLSDHFLWTLQEGRLIFWLSAGLLTPLLKTRSK